MGGRAPGPIHVPQRLRCPAGWHTCSAPGLHQDAGGQPPLTILAIVTTPGPPARSWRPSVLLGRERTGRQTSLLQRSTPRPSSCEECTAQSGIVRSVASQSVRAASGPPAHKDSCRPLPRGWADRPSPLLLCCVRVVLLVYPHPVLPYPVLSAQCCRACDPCHRRRHAASRGSWRALNSCCFPLGAHLTRAGARSRRVPGCKGVGRRKAPPKISRRRRRSQNGRAGVGVASRKALVVAVATYSPELGGK